MGIECANVGSNRAKRVTIVQSWALSVQNGAPIVQNWALSVQSGHGVCKGVQKSVRKCKNVQRMAHSGAQCCSMGHNSEA